MKNLLKKLLTVSPLKISIFVIVLSIILFLSNVMLFNFVELKSLDLRFKSRGVRQPGGETLIVAIDEKSLNELGQWPWPRSVIARLVDTLESFGVKAIGFDVVFAEPDETSSVRELDNLERVMEENGITDPKLRRILDERKKLADNDLILAESLKKTGNVALGYFFHATSEEVGHLTKEDIAQGETFISRSKYKIVQIKGTPDESPLITAYAVAPNIGIISEATENSGYFNSFPDVDGTNRWASLVIKFGENYYPSLPLVVLEHYLDRPMLALTMAQYGVDNVQIGDVTIPTNESGRMLINYLGPAKTFPHYSVSDIINHRLDPEIFRNRIVLIGATATGIYDLRVTPFSTVYPGLEACRLSRHDRRLHCGKPVRIHHAEPVAERGLSRLHHSFCLRGHHHLQVRDGRTGKEKDQGRLPVLSDGLGHYGNSEGPFEAETGR
ncbi:MAG: CHASE2 domain-containing protein [Deltaproteobacteria bacterium]|nr:CHASE2 domain-containing protein [Deltaproteobacteria bacterium]